MFVQKLQLRMRHCARAIECFFLQISALHKIIALSLVEAKNSTLQKPSLSDANAVFERNCCNTKNKITIYVKKTCAEIYAYIISYLDIYIVATRTFIIVYLFILMSNNECVEIRVKVEF